MGRPVQSGVSGAQVELLGSWVSQELLVEPAPRIYASFQNRRMPEPHEQAASKLIDERWLAVLRDLDNYLEARRRLGQTRGKGDSSRPSH